MLSYFNVWKHTIEKSWFFPCPPTELIKSENIPKLNSLCQKVPLLFWVSHESYAAWAAQWDPVWLALFLGYRGMSIPQGSRVPQGSEHPTEDQDPTEGMSILLLNSHGPFQHDGFGFWQWCTGFELVCVLISCCAWETLIPAEGCWGLCLEEQSTSDGVRAWVVGMFSSWVRSSLCYPQCCTCLFVCYFFVVLHHILGEACKCLNKVKFLKSELNQPESKPVGGHESTCPEFWGEELHFAAYHGCGTHPAWFSLQADFGTCQGELCCRVCCSWGTQRAPTWSHLFFITLCSSNINTKVCGHCYGQGEPDAKGIPPRLYKLQDINILVTVF